MNFHFMYVYSIALLSVGILHQFKLVDAILQLVLQIMLIYFEALLTLSFIQSSIFWLRKCDEWWWWPILNSPYCDLYASPLCYFTSSWPIIDILLLYLLVSCKNWKKTRYFFQELKLVDFKYILIVFLFVLQNFGFVTPIPTLALVVTALVGVLTAFFIFQSASRD